LFQAFSKERDEAAQTFYDLTGSLSWFQREAFVPSGWPRPQHPRDEDHQVAAFAFLFVNFIKLGQYISLLLLNHESGNSLPGITEPAKFQIYNPCNFQTALIATW